MYSKIIICKDKTMKVALATSDGAFVAKHFGNTPFFLVAEVDSQGWRIIEKRENIPACDHTEHNHERFAKSANVIRDCGAVICAKIGGFAQNELSAMGIQALEKTGFYDEALNGYVKYLARNVKIKPKNIHPCFNDEARGKKGRIHLPVSAKCNIKCRFCERNINANELCPGVSQGILDPERAVDTVDRALILCPEISVIGVAGPGDALADDAALVTFRQVREKFPQLLLCLSTNGLGLAGKAQTLYDAGVRHLTVTVNAVDPSIGEKIVSLIKYEGKTYTGMEAAQILLERQLAGIKEACALDIEVKVNTVLIPGINDEHIGEIARVVSALGAKYINIMPLIPRGEFSQTPPPGCNALEKAREQAQRYMPVFRHCAHCRADACGVPGISEFAGELYKDTEVFRCGNICN